MKKERLVVFGVALLPLVAYFFMFYHPARIMPPPKTPKDFLISVYGKEHAHYILIPDGEPEPYSGDEFDVGLRLENGCIFRYAVTNKSTWLAASPLFMRKGYARRLSVLLDGEWYRVPPCRERGLRIAGMRMHDWLAPGSVYISDILLAAGESNAMLPSGHYRLELYDKDGWFVLEFKLNLIKYNSNMDHKIEIISK